MRTFDASVVNAIVNRYPEIAAAITHDPAHGPFDAQPYVNALYTVILMDNRRDGAALFEWSSPNIWQAHTVFAPSCRGRDAIACAKAMIREMFIEWEAEEIWGQTPVANRAAHIFNRKVGARYAGEGDHWSVGAVQYFRIKRDEWLAEHGSLFR